MKRLFLIRHAKSSWRDASLSDRDRPLKGRGVDDAHLMSELLISVLKESIIISSPARRAQETAAIFQKQLGISEIRTDERIYFQGMEGLESAIMDAVNDSLLSGTSDFLVFGHNPIMESFVESFLGNYQKFPTCAMAQFEILDEPLNNLDAQLKLSWTKWPSQHRF